MESAWKTQAARWELLVPTQPLIQAKRAHPCNTPSSIVKKYRSSRERGTVLEGWLDGPCKIHATPDNIPTHSLRACWILRKVAKSGEDILTALSHLLEYPTCSNAMCWYVIRCCVYFAWPIEPSFKNGSAPHTGLVFLYY